MPVRAVPQPPVGCRKWWLTHRQQGSSRPSGAAATELARRKVADAPPAHAALSNVLVRRLGPPLPGLHLGEIVGGLSAAE